MTTTVEAVPNINEDNDVSVDNLYPALIQCFAIILSGYFWQHFQ